jgi:secreted Zn-dependent insulinase-like peptidase
VLTRLAVKLLQYDLNEVTYPAELAGLAFSASNTLTGFQVRLGAGGSGVWGFRVCG